MSSFIITINYTFSSDTYIWGLGKRYWWTYLQGRHGGADVGDGLVHTVGEGESETKGESSVNMHSLSGGRWIVGEKLLYITQEVQSGALWWPGGRGKGGRLKRQGIYVWSCSVSQACSTLQSHASWHEACQDSLSFSVSWSLLTLMFIEFISSSTTSSPSCL